MAAPTLLAAPPQERLAAGLGLFPYYYLRGGKSMANEITLPEMGENVEEGEVVDVKVAVGAEVKEGQPLLEVEAEKSTVEVPSPSAGRISKVMVKKGDKVKTGQTLFQLEAAGAAPQEESRPAPKVEAKAAAAPSPKSPPAFTAPPAAVPSARRPAESGAVATQEKVVPAGPATRRLARELGIDLARVRGSATGGRVTQEDVKNFVRDLATGTAAPAEDGQGVVVKVPPLPDFSKWGPVERKPMDAVRRKTAEQMALSWSLVPHVTQHDLADITDLEAFRKQQDGRGPKLTVTAFALKSSAIALRQFPQFNSTLDLGNNQLILKQYYHIGIAVDTERGLLVPVLRDVDKKSVHDLAKEMAEVADKARQKKIAGDDLRGGTFTITNLGSIGGTGFTPIVNYPEVAILGLSRSRLQPVVRASGEVVPRLMLPLSLSYDHRVIDGADAARFVRRIVEMLENPLVMLLHA
jgi:pyruvate dehydrogenase E2 component (dihydrolipoamide acetyltransferase)